MASSQGGERLPRTDLANLDNLMKEYVKGKKAGSIKCNFAQFSDTKMHAGVARASDAGKIPEPDSKKRKADGDDHIPANNDEQQLEDVVMNDDTTLEDNNSDKNDFRRNVHNNTRMNDKVDKIRDRFKYSRQERGPFAVYIKTTGELVKSKPIKAIEVARKLANNNIRFDNIAESSRNTWRLTFTLREAANDCLSNLNLEKNGLEAFVPMHLRFKKGVVRDIPVDVSLEELKKCIQEENKNTVVSDIHRLKKKNNKPSADKHKWIDSSTVRITFSSSVLPRQIRLWGILLPVSDYIPPVRICFNCGKFGHIKDKCKSQKVCLSCSQIECLGHDQCHNDKKCVNCDGDHHTLDNKCPNKSAEIEIKKIMTRDNLSFPEAKRLVNPNKDLQLQQKNSYFRGTQEDFPSLRTKENENTTMATTTPTWSRPNSKPLLEDLKGSEIEGKETGGAAHIGEALEELLRAFMMSTDVELLIKHLRKAVEIHLKNHGRTR